MTPSPDFGVRPGDVVAGKYRVERMLGVGGMGIVVAAHHLQLDQKVALKFLSPQAVGNGEIVARFDREARAAVRIRSEHVARVIDVGRLEGGAPYMVMEYLEGADLAGWLDAQGALPVEQAVEFVLQACEAIAEAHSLGIVHRDLKPANLFCIRRPDGSLSIKVLDFGISKAVGMTSRDLGMTRTASIVGSPFYMSPEQMHSARSVDARTDIWSLGVILFELLTNTVPFSAEAIPELVMKVLRDAPPSMSSQRPDVPAGLELVVSRCLEKDRTRRYPNVGELAVALAEYGPPRGRLSVEVVRGIVYGAPHESGLAQTAVVAPAAGPRPPTMAPWAHTGSPPRATTGHKTVPARWLAIVPAAVTVAALGAIAGHGGVSCGPDAHDAAGGLLDPGRPAAEAATDDAFDAGVPPQDAADPPDARDAGNDGGHGKRDGGLPPPPPPPPPQPPPPPPPPPTASDCSPPYFYDAQGNKVFKIWCVP